jgi:hypothetical protein
MWVEAQGMLASTRASSFREANRELAPTGNSAIVMFCSSNPLPVAAISALWQARDSKLGLPVKFMLGGPGGLQECLRVDTDGDCSNEVPACRAPTGHTA